MWANEILDNKLQNKRWVSTYRVSQEETLIFWEVIISATLSKKVYMFICRIPDGVRDRVTSLYITLHTAVSSPECRAKL
jgi:hypothetical protein